MGTAEAPDAAAAVERAIRLATEDRCNAFTSVDPSAAERARRLGSGDGPLWGTPIAVKDLIDHTGRVTTAGSSFYRHLATATAPAISRLETLGAVVIGRTGLHEFAYGFSSENDWFGPVRNPWDPATSPGGSSGGSAAAVAAGVVDGAIGTDTGGSVRVPAALCGCFGLKVTHGRVPLTGVFPLAASLDTVGPIAIDMATTTAMYLAMAGHDPSDPWSAVQPVVAPSEIGLEGLRIAVPHPWVDRALDRPVADALAGFRTHATARGAAVEDLDVPALDPTTTPDATYAEVGSVHRSWFSEDPERYGPDIRARLGRALEHGVDDLAVALRWRAGIRSRFASIFEDFDLLVTPTVPVLRKEIGVDTVVTSEGPEPYRHALSWFTVLVNQAGLPALAVPVAGTSRTPMPPASLQLIAPWFGEAPLLGVGHALERGGFVGSVRPHS